MSLRPRVSVVIPAYQSETRIGRTLARLKQQTFRDFEIVVVNDGSTDGTASVIDRAMAEDARIRVVEQSNRGLARARNRGVEESRGDLIAFLDDDDLWHPQKLALQVARFDGGTAPSVVTCYSALVDIDKDGHSKLIRQATSGSVIFRPEYWGKGIASAAHKARTWYAFTQLGLHRIKSAVIQANGGSRKALERSGYTLVYTERNEQYSDGQFHHLDCLECLNPLDLFWSQWWHGNRPTKASREARQRTCEVLNWADKNVELA